MTVRASLLASFKYSINDSKIKINITLKIEDRVYLQVLIKKKIHLINIKGIGALSVSLEACIAVASQLINNVVLSLGLQT